MSDSKPSKPVDAVCDQPGDKGVDGIYINEDANTVEIYQSKISQKKAKTIGDTLLKEFAGTLKQFESVETLIRRFRFIHSAGAG